VASVDQQTRDVLARAARQALRIETLAKLAVLKARAPAKYYRLMHLEAKKRGLTKPKG
jgi:hypothetical protein